MSHPGPAGLRIDVPSAAADRPGWSRVGVIAAIGFIVGIAWPKVAGVRLGPSAPGESASATSAVVTAPLTSAPSAAEPSAPPSAAARASASPSAGQGAATGDTAAPTVTVTKGGILSCRTSDGETKKGKDCGTGPGIDAIVNARFKRLSSCPTAKGATGKLSAILTFDFGADAVTVGVGKSSTVDNPDTIAQCLASSFKGAPLSQAAHEHSRYVVAYSAMFTNDSPAKGTGATATNEAALVATASEEGTIAWEVGLVRDSPKTGSIVARLPRGTKVKLAGGKDGWYEVSYGAAFDQKGWLYRGALGK